MKGTVITFFDLLLFSALMCFPFSAHLCDQRKWEDEI